MDGEREREREREGVGRKRQQNLNVLKKNSDIILSLTSEIKHEFILSLIFNYNTFEFISFLSNLSQDRKSLPFKFMKSLSIN